MRHSGTILIAVLIMTVLAGMVAAGLLFRARASVSALAAVDSGEQAYAAAMSGVQRAMVVLKSAGASMEDWFDNPDVFGNQLVCDDGANRWYFTVYAPNPADPTNIRYGPIDEGAKINVNVAEDITMQLLSKLTVPQVDCLLDYKDGDGITREQGAEQDYYDAMPYPYLIKNGNLATVEELLLVKGFDASVVYGEDANMNGVLDPNENDGQETHPPDDGDGQLDLGLRSMLTTVTYWPMVDSQGRPTVDVNSPPAVLLETGLSEQTVRFVDLYRKDGNSEIRYPTDLLEMKHTLTRDCHDAKGALVPLGTEIKTDIGQTELELICDRLSDGRGGSHSFRQGLVNVNTAPMEVLACLPRINEASARAIADMRGSLSSEAKSTIAWLYTRGVVDAETFRYIAPKITARSYQYRVQCIGFGVPCGRIRVIETIVDTARRRPKIIYLRDITRLGVPFALDVEVKETPRT